MFMGLLLILWSPGIYRLPGFSLARGGYRFADYRELPSSMNKEREKNYGRI
jgi:hypothetical protein